MRRAELIAAIAELNRALEEANLLPALDAARQHRERSSTLFDLGKLLPPLKVYAVEAARFDAPTRRLVEVFALGDAEDPTYWFRMLAAETATESISSLFHRFRYARAFLPKMGELLNEGGHRAVAEARAAADPARAASALAVVLPEEDGQFSSPARLSAALDGVRALYEACCTFSGDNANTLSVAALDSGGDKVLDFLGAPRATEGVRSTLLAVWERMLFYRSRPAGERLQLICDSLPLTARLRHLVEQARLSPEQAELTRRAIQRGVEQFLAAGAMLPEFATQPPPDPRAMLTPAPKLLARPVQLPAEPE